MRGRLKRWRDKHLILADAITAVVAVAAVLGIAVAVSSSPELLSILDGTRAAAYGTLASIFGSLLGFVLAAVSIISAFGDSPRFDLMRSRGRFHEIFSIFFHATYVLAFGTVWSLVALIFDTDQRPNAYVTVVSALVFALSIARVYRCIWILRAMIQITNEPIRQTQPQ